MKELTTTISRSDNKLPMTAAEMKGQIGRIQEVMKAVMKEGTHYGKIPGTSKPTLYKAGSEVLLTTFHIGVDPIVEDLSTRDVIRYRVRAVGKHQITDIVMGAGIGECSSDEEKYKWRAAICEAEFEDTDPDRRRIAYKKVWNDQTRRKDLIAKVRQVRVDPADVANTVLKIAKKRAQTDMTLTALAASDIFTQDAEDLPEGMQDVADDAPRGKPETKAPKAKGKIDGEKPANKGQINLIRKKLGDADDSALCEHLGINSLDDLTFGQVNDALAYLTNDKS